MKMKIIGMPLYYGCDINGSDQAYKYLFDDNMNDIFNGDHSIVENVLINVPTVDIDNYSNIAKYKEAITIADNSLMIEVRDAINNGYFPLTIGGDHALAIGSITGLKDAIDEDIAIIWIDAHTDIHTEQTSVSHNVHGMPLAVLLGESNIIPMNSIKQGPKIKTKDIYYIGVRSIDEPEMKYVIENNITYYTDLDVHNLGVPYIVDEIKEKINNKKVYMSFDVDAFDPSIFSAVSVPAINGLTIDEGKELLNEFFDKTNIVCIDFVEYNPLFDKNNECKHACQDLLKIISSKLKKEDLS